MAELLPGGSAKSDDSSSRRNDENAQDIFDSKAGGDRAAPAKGKELGSPAKDDARTSRPQRLPPQSLSSDVDYVLYPSRWFVLAVFSLLSMMNAAVCFTYAPVAHSAQAQYGVSHTRLNSLIAVFFIGYVVTSFAGSRFITKHGLRKSVLLGAWLQAAGAGMRCFATPATGEFEFALLITGQILAALAQPFLVNPPSLVAARWFGPNERTLATTIAVNFNHLGTGFIYILAPRLVSGPEDVENYSQWVALPCALLATAAVIYFPDQPATPPSRSEALKRSADAMAFPERQRGAQFERSLETAAGNAAPMGSPHGSNGGLFDDTAMRSMAERKDSDSDGEEEEEDEEYGRALDDEHSEVASMASQAAEDAGSTSLVQVARLFENPGFIHTVAAFSVVEVLINALASNLGLMLHPLSEQFTGYVGCSFIFAIFLGSSVFGPVIDRTRRHKVWMLLLLFLSAGAFLLFVAVDSAAERIDKTAAFVSLTVLGFLAGEVQPLALEIATECTYPAPEALLGGVQQVVGNLLSAVIIPITVALRRHNGDMSLGNWLLFAFYVSGAAYFCFFKGTFARLSTDRRKFMQHHHAKNHMLDDTGDVEMGTLESDSARAKK